MIIFMLYTRLIGHHQKQKEKQKKEGKKESERGKGEHKGESKRGSGGRGPKYKEAHVGIKQEKPRGLNPAAEVHTVPEHGEASTVQV